jgi:hypothetical protein
VSAAASVCCVPMACWPKCRFTPLPRHRPRPTLHEHGHLSPQQVLSQRTDQGKATLRLGIAGRICALAMPTTLQLRAANICAPIDDFETVSLTMTRATASRSGPAASWSARCATWSITRSKHQALAIVDQSRTLPPVRGSRSSSSHPTRHGGV